MDSRCCVERPGVWIIPPPGRFTSGHAERSTHYGIVRGALAWMTRDAGLSKGRDTHQAHVAERRDRAAETFEQARSLHDPNEHRYKRDPVDERLAKFCQDIRESRGYPIGLWAVVTDRITAHDFGMALSAGHRELVEYDLGEWDVVNSG